jgi:poly(3-hydroxybutyrate) depolymerase
VLLNAQPMRFVPGRRRFVSAAATALALAGVCLGVAESAASQPTPAASAAQATGMGPACDKPISGNRTISLTVGGHVRTALLHVPKSVPDRALPLLIALHGAAGSGPEFARDSGLSTEGDEEGFDVVYPTSLGPQWAISSSGRDVAFASALLDRVESIACIDLTRVSATGVSIGAGMAARIGCELSPRIAGLVLISGGYRSLPACNPRHDGALRRPGSPRRRSRAAVRRGVGRPRQVHRQAGEARRRRAHAAV